MTAVDLANAIARLTGTDAADYAAARLYALRNSHDRVAVERLEDVVTALDEVAVRPF